MTKSVFPGNAAPANAVPISIVIVTMDTHLASATERAYRRLLRDFPGLSLRLHAATEWGDDPAALARCRADIAGGDIIISAMLFMEDHYREIMADLKARRDNCDALVSILSASEVMTLTRIGRFTWTVSRAG